MKTNKTAADYVDDMAKLSRASLKYFMFYDPKQLAEIIEQAMTDARAEAIEECANLLEDWPEEFLYYPKPMAQAIKRLIQPHKPGNVNDQES